MQIKHLLLSLFIGYGLTVLTPRGGLMKGIKDQTTSVEVKANIVFREVRIIFQFLLVLDIRCIFCEFVQSRDGKVFTVIEQYFIYFCLSLCVPLSLM